MTGNIHLYLCFAVFFASLMSKYVYCRIQECGHTFSTLNGTIILPKPTDTQSASFSRCILMIDTRNQTVHNTHAQHLEFHMTSFHVTGLMPFCNQGNYLEVFIGCHFVSIGRFCGVSTFPVFYSTDGCLALGLHGIVRELRAEYRLRPSNQEVEHIPSGCGTASLANTRHGNIFSPRWPLPFPDYVDCVWTVKAHKNLQIKLIFFDFDVNVYEPCRRLDVLEVRAGSSGYIHARTLKTKDSHCGRKEPFHMIINSDTFYITFRSDRNTGPRGFMAGFIAYERETTTFQSNILIVFGGALLVLIIVSMKKFIIPCIMNNCNKGRRDCFCFSKTPEGCGYVNCSCRRQRPSAQIMDCPYMDTSDVPVVQKDCFLDPSECWEFPSVESTFVPTTPTVTKSASDIRCWAHGYTGTDGRQPSSKSVRFAAESREYRSTLGFESNS